MPHPLFPSDDPHLDVAFIHVTRHERHGQVYAPRLFPADELQGLETIQMMYGGGNYELIGRGTNKSRITARARYVLAGPSIPLVPEEPTGPTPPPAATYAPPPPQPQFNDNIIALVLQQQQQMTQLMMQMMTNMMNTARGDSKAFMESLARLTEADKANMSRFFEALVNAKGGGTSAGDAGAELLIKGLELGVEMTKRDGEAVAAAAAAAQPSDLQVVLDGVKTFAMLDAQKQAATAAAKATNGVNGASSHAPARADGAPDPS